MTRSSTKRKRYALTLAKYVARFHDVPPSILSEDGATEPHGCSLRPGNITVDGLRVRGALAVLAASRWSLSNSRSGLGSP